MQQTKNKQTSSLWKKANSGWVKTAIKTKQSDSYLYTFKLNFNTGGINNIYEYTLNSSRFDDFLLDA